MKLSLLFLHPIRTDGKAIFINGVKGPLKEQYKMKIVTDNSTRTDFDLGQIGGHRMATAEYKGDNDLTIYLHKISKDYSRSGHTKDVIDIITTTVINPENHDEMTYTMKDVATGVELIQTFYKQNFQNWQKDW